MWPPREFILPLTAPVPVTMPAGLRMSARPPPTFTLHAAKKQGGRGKGKKPIDLNPTEFVDSTGGVKGRRRLKKSLEGLMYREKNLKAWEAELEELRLKLEEWELSLLEREMKLEEWELNLLEREMKLEGKEGESR